MNEEIENVVIIYVNGIKYSLKTDGKIYFYDESGNCIKLDDEKKEQEIKKYFQSPRIDIK